MASWVDNGRGLMTLAMGPVQIRIARAASGYMFCAWLRAGARKLLIVRDPSDGAPLAECQAAAITAVEQWRESIR